MSHLFENTKILRYTSLAVLGGYAVSLCYRAGLIQKVLPATVNQKLEDAVEAVKEKTAPIGNPRQLAFARAHLTKVYTLASAGMIAFCGGVLTFVVQPKVPIAFPVLTTLVPALLVVGVPRAYMKRGYRVLNLCLTFFSAGYAFGPIGWIAQDSLFLFLLCTVCTMSGLVVPLSITRGLISYLLSTQLFSLSLLVSFLTAPKEATRRYSPFNTLKSQKGVKMIMDADYNVVVTLQVVANVVLLALHTVPVLYYVVTHGKQWSRAHKASACASTTKRNGVDSSSIDDSMAAAASASATTGPEEYTEEELEMLDHLDDVLEAFCICAGWSYILFRFIRHYMQFFIKKLIESNGGTVGTVGDSASGGGVPESMLGIMANDRRVDARKASGVVSTGLVFLWYIKAIGLLQRGDPGATLDQFRYVCDRISPLRWLLGVPKSS